MPAGRKLTHNNCMDLDAACELYFETCEDEGIHPTISGLAYAIGFKGRRSITDYKQRDEFSPTIKKARLYVESYLEQKLYGNSVTGVIFNLKNNFGWKDQQDVNNTGEMTQKIKWES